MLPGDGGSCFDGISDLDSVLNDNPVPWPCTMANGKRASHLEGFLSNVLCNPQVTGREEKERYHRRVLWQGLVWELKHRSVLSVSSAS